MDIGYYQRSISSNQNTTPYRHAHTIGRRSDSELLLADHRPPDEIASLYPNITVFEEEGIQGVYSKITQGIQKVSKYIGSEGKLITGIGLPPMMVGYLTRSDWIADIYDDPVQTSTINPNSTIRQASAIVQCKLLKRADLSIITQHPSTPLTPGKKTVFLLNGAPIELVEPGQKHPRKPVRCVIAGKTKLSQGMDMTLRAIELANVSVTLDVFGEKSDQTIQFVKKLGIDDKVTFHGKAPLGQVLKQLSTSHIGFCLLPERRDWNYAYPIKVGEYLAAGVLPIATPRPGIVELAASVGELCENPEQASTALEELAHMGDPEYQALIGELRARAEQIAWGKELEKFNSCIDRGF